MSTPSPETFMQEAIRLAEEGMRSKRGGPFGCVVVRRGEIVGRGNNRVTSTNDPTAHAEVTAIREACRELNTFQLADCELYTSCEPCPMCLGAIYWARPARVVYANTREDAAAVGFDDDFIYEEINAPMSERKIPFEHEEHAFAKEVFQQWKDWEGKKEY